MRLALPLLALALLPACRTAYTYAPPATLEEAVALIDTATVTLTTNNGSTRRIRRLRLTDSTLVFSPSRRSTVHEVPRQEVLQLALFNTEGHIGQGLLLTVYGFFVGGAVGAKGACVATKDTATRTCGLTGFALGGVAGSLLFPALLNPSRNGVVYRRAGTTLPSR